MPIDRIGKHVDVLPSFIAEHFVSTQLKAEIISDIKTKICSITLLLDSKQPIVSDANSNHANWRERNDNRNFSKMCRKVTGILGVTIAFSDFYFPIGQLTHINEASLQSNFG